MTTINSGRFVALLLLNALWTIPARADTRYIVRVNGGLPIMQLACRLVGCNVANSLDGTLGQVFLVTTSSTAPATTFVTTLLRQIGVVDVETDLLASVADSSYTVPPALSDSAPVDYFGTTVPHGYVNQPATQIVRLSDTQSTFGVRGAGTVAVIDTGIDPNHPALRNAWFPVTISRGISTEKVTKPATFLFLDHAFATSQSSWVNPRSAAGRSVHRRRSRRQSAIWRLRSRHHGGWCDPPGRAGCELMPLKAFGSDGTGYTSDILRAIYWAVQNNANIINMSFNLAAYSDGIEKRHRLRHLARRHLCRCRGERRDNTHSFIPPLCRM